MRAAVAVLLAACSAPGEPAAGPAPATRAPAVDARDPARGVLDLDPPAAAGAMAPNLAPGASGEALLTWVEPDGSAQRVRLSRLKDMSWSAATTVAAGERVLASWADAPALARAADGSLLASWGESGRGESSSLMLGRAGAGGGRWKSFGRAHDDTTETEHGFAALVADGDGALAVWLDGRATVRGEPTMLRGIEVGERGLTGPALLDKSVCDCCPTASAMTTRGPIVAYRDRAGDEVRDIAVVRRVDGTWTEPAQVHADGWRIRGCPVNGPAIAARGDLVAVAWYTEAGGSARVRAAFSRDGGARFADPVEVDVAKGARVPLGRVAIALDRAGDALVTWVAAKGRSAEILVRRVAADGGAGPERMVAATSAARSNGIPRALRLDEWLLVVWTDARRLRATAIALREIGAPVVAPAPAPAAAGERRSGLGQPAAPQWVGKTAEGRAVRMADLRGKVVVMNLWATWCTPCIAEFPHLVELHRTWAGRGVEFIGLSTDEDAARTRAIASWKKLGPPFTLWLDPNETGAIDFAAPSIPVTIVIDRRGVVRFRHDDQLTAAADRELTAAIEAALDAR